MRIRTCLVLVLSLLLSSCGWQLKGGHENLKNIGKVYIGNDGWGQSDITKTVRAELRAGGLEVSKWRGDADYVLFISNERSTLHTASYDVLVRAAENTMIMEIDYQLQNAEGEVISGPDTIYAERVYEYDVQGATSSAAQLTIIVRELRERLGQQIVRRFAAYDPAAETTPETANTE